MSKKHYDYVKPIIEWGREKGLLSKGDLDMQLEKSREENAELTKAITKYEMVIKMHYMRLKMLSEMFM